MMFSKSIGKQKSMFGCLLPQNVYKINVCFLIQAPQTNASKHSRYLFMNSDASVTA